MIRQNPCDYYNIYASYDNSPTCLSQSFKLPTKKYIRRQLKLKILSRVCGQRTGGGGGGRTKGRRDSLTRRCAGTYVRTYVDPAGNLVGAARSFSRRDGGRVSGRKEQRGPGGLIAGTICREREVHQLFIVAPVYALFVICSLARSLARPPARSGNPCRQAHARIYAQHLHYPSSDS